MTNPTTPAKKTAAKKAAPAPSSQVAALEEDRYFPIFKDIRKELAAQLEKWGEQNHPLVGGELPSQAQSYYASQAEGWKRVNDKRVEDDVMGWDSILIEEVFEALGESDVELARAEWVQVAAVAAQAIDYIDRNTKAVA